MRRADLWGVVGLCGLIFWLPAVAAVTPELQHSIRENTFEVVLKKPEKDPVSYEKPLPLDLLPYLERTDAYRSIGTAFALGGNTYVTAGHVIIAGVDTQMGPPALRRADGKVFAIDKVLKFSLPEDFVVFSLREDPDPSGLAVNREPKIDQAVLAVGNALGEGIVIRDGLYTSETPEAQDGRWKWIRFSAAASPGNSGGPLCDEQGRVVGIVLRKSPSENLNYSLPISRVLDAEPSKAKFDERSLVTLPYLHGTFTYSYRDQFALPLSWQAFATAFQKVIVQRSDEARGQLLKTYADTLFPKGTGSESVLFDPTANSAQPRLIAQKADGTWSAEPLEYHSIDLPGDGSVAFADAPGGRLLTLIRSGSASDDAFYSDSKAAMDLALKALDLRRSVGQDAVRVTSLGSAVGDTIYLDAYGRKWQERTWGVPFLDAYLVAEMLPTPNGYAAVITATPSAALKEVQQVLRLMATQVDVSYRGTLAQWRAALKRRTLLPDALTQVKLVEASGWALQTPRFTSSVPPAVLNLTDKSLMTLTMGFTSDGTKALWDVQGVSWDRDERMDNGFDLWRRQRPPAAAKLDLRSRYESIQQHRSPYDGSMSRESAEVYSASSVIDVPGKNSGWIASDLEYGVTLRFTDRADMREVKTSLGRISEATRILERGVAEDMAPRRTAGNASIAPSLTAPLHSDTLLGIGDTQAGPDLRGRFVSQDVQDYLNPIARDKERTRQVSEALTAYWTEYPALLHNRDMFATFLAKNRYAPETPHDAAVLAAEARLMEALKSGPPSPEWQQLAHTLLRAYVDERNSKVRDVARMSDAIVYAPRQSACPPAATTTSGNAHPRLASSPRSLEDFWPLQSKRLGEEGTVVIALKISSGGCATGMAILGSSGSDYLDGAVMQYVETVAFLPAADGGRPIESRVSMPVVFKLH